MNEPVTIEGTVTFLEPGDLRPQHKEKIALGCWPKNWSDKTEKGIAYDVCSAYPKIAADKNGQHEARKRSRKLPDFSIVGVLGGHLWFYGVMPGVELGCRITITGTPDECGIEVSCYSFVNPTPLQEIIMETLAQNGKIHYLDDSSIFTSGCAPAKTVSNAPIMMLPKVLGKVKTKEYGGRGSK